MRSTLLLVLIAGGAFGQASHPSYSVKRIAGVAQTRANGVAANSALLMRPFSVTQDRAGSLYIADLRGISAVSATGELRVVSGSHTISARGIGNTAILGSDPAGEILLADGARVLRRFADGRQVVIAGGGPPGSRSDGIAATQADLGCVSGLTSDRAGNIYVSCFATAAVRRIGSDGLIRTVAGNFLPGSNGDGGPAIRAHIVPWHITTDTNGALYIYDVSGLRIRRVTSDGIIQTIAGGGTSMAEGVPALLASMNQVGGLAVDGTGNVYLSEPAANRIRRFTPGGTISTIAGSANMPGDAGDGGAAGAARLNQPGSLLLDRDGNVVVVDTGNNRVRKVSQGIFPTISSVAGASHFRGDDGPAAEALLNGPAAIAADATGNLYIADSLNARVRRVGADSGLITTVAGTGSLGFSGDGGPAKSAELRMPMGVAADRSGSIWISDGERIRRISTSGVISTVATGLATGGPVTLDGAGNLLIGQVSRVSSLSPSGAVTNLTGSGAGSISGIAQDSQGNLYVTDEASHVVRRVTSSGVAQVIAGSIGTSGASGDGGLATAALLNRPKAIAVDNQGNLFIADSEGRRVRRIGQDGRIDTVAGRAEAGAEPPQEVPSGQSGLSVTFGQITSLLADSTGGVYFTDSDLNIVGRLTPLMPEKVSIVSGNGQLGVTESKLPLDLVVRITDAQGLPIVGISVDFYVLSGLAYLSSETASTGANGTATVSVTLGNIAGTVQIASSTSGLTPVVFTLTAIQRVNPQPPSQTRYTVETSAGTALPNNVLRGAQGVAVDREGNVYFSDPASNRVLAIANDGGIRLFAGTGVRGNSTAKDFAYLSRISGPAGVAAGLNNSVVFADRENHRICRVTGDQVFEVVAGTGERGYNGDRLNSLAAQLARPAAVAVDGSGLVFVADTENYLIRRVEADGTLVNVVGTGRLGSSPDGTVATEASIGTVEAIALDGQGRLYFAEGSRVRMVSASGVLLTIAEAPARGLAFDAAGNLYFTEGARLRRMSVDGSLIDVPVNGLVRPDGLAVGIDGSIWIADGLRIVRVDGTTAEVSTATGGAVPSGDDGFANLALLNNPLGLAADRVGGLYIADTGNLRLRYQTPGGVIQTVMGGSDATRLVGPGYVAVDARDTVNFSDGAFVRRFTVARVLTTVAGPFAAGAIGCMTLNPAGELVLCIGNQIQRLATDGSLQVIAGNGQAGFGPDGGQAVATPLTQPRSAVYDKAGNLLFVEAGNRRVRSVAPNGAITTARGAAVENPVAVAVNGEGNLYVADPYQIYKISPDGVMVVIAGVGRNGFGGDGGAAGEAEFDGIQAMVIDGAGNLYIADAGNNRVRKLSPVY